MANRNRIPDLFELAKCYIKIPASSCDCERALSKYKNLLDDRRYCLTEDNINIFNFLYFNNSSEELRDSNLIPKKTSQFYFVFLLT